MKQVSIAALALAMALGGVAVTPAPAKEKPAADTGPKLSPEVMKAAGPIQTALKNKDFATAKASLETIIPSVQTEDDKYYVGNWMIQVGQATSDLAETSKGIDLELQTSKVDADMLPKLAFVQGQLAYQAKDYPKAQAAMQRAIDAGNADPDAVPILVDAMQKQGMNTQAMQALVTLIDKTRAANRPVPNEWFQRGFAIAYTAKKTDPGFAAMRQAGIKLTMQWLTVTSTGEVWHDALLLYRESVTLDFDGKLDIYRLSLAANGLRGGPEYLEYADDVYQRYPAEAKAVIDAAVAKGALVLATNRGAQEINQIVTGKIPADKASLAGSDKAARAAATGKVAINTGDAYYGYGDYAKAIDLYTVAGQKGGVDADVVNTRIGVALFRSGDKPGAKAAFAKVTGPRKPIADFWTILIDHPAAP